MVQPSAGSYVDLLWLPLGAVDSSGLVRRTGRLYERISARPDHRPRRALTTPPCRYTCPDLAM